MIETIEVVEGRYTEAFFSVQGEAKNTGRLCTWLRLFSCNLQCKGFGSSDPADPTTWKSVTGGGKDFDAIADVQTPAFGCDSAYSWDASYKHMAISQDSNEVADVLRDTIPSGRYSKYIGHVFTGGEPMIQQEFIAAVITAFIESRDIPAWIAIETNGTKKLKPVLEAAIKAYMATGREFYFSVSPKLHAVSGEHPDKAIKLDVIESYLKLCASSYLKFVLNLDERAWRQAAAIEAELSDAEVWVMPVGGLIEQQTSQDVAEIADRAIFVYGWNVAPRVHVMLWGDDQIGR